ncbi:MAG TPA: VOC family protein [Polyangiaceae bacterium]|nr:VOC family protein [Polyangiaceae bacterium]
MDWELDHVFAATTDLTSEQAARDLGMTFTERRVHRGQGTANACAVFENAFFELLFPSQPEEIVSDLVRPLGLDERTRWRETGACPFGVCFRPLAELSEGTDFPFQTWPYQPAYVPEGSSIPIVTPRGSLLEPLVFLMTRPRAFNSTIGSPLHRGSRRMLTAIAIEGPHAAHSPAVRWFVDQGLLPLRRRPEYTLELILDGGRAGASAQSSERLPVTIRW